MRQLHQKSIDSLERLAIKATRFIGSTDSILIHTAIFIIAFILYFFGVPFEKILLVVTTIVSLEAIYLSIFIQMSVNRQARKLHAVARDVDEIQEDVEGIEKDVDEIQRDVDEIQRDVDEIQEDVEGIEKDVEEIQEGVEEIQEEDDTEENEQKKDTDAILRIEETLKILIGEISELKNQRSAKTKIKKD